MVDTKLRNQGAGVRNGKWQPREGVGEVSRRNGLCLIVKDGGLIGRVLVVTMKLTWRMTCKEGEQGSRGVPSKSHA